MKTPLQRIQSGAVFLVAIFVAAVIGYRFLGEDYDWISAIWMVVITISTVGYAEQSSFDPSLQLFTVMVILLGISAAAYTFGGMVQLMLEGEIDRAIGKRRMTRELNQLNDHVLICGFGRMGQNLAHELQAQGRPYVVIESNAEAAAEANSRDIRCVVGDATTEDVMRLAGIERAHTIVAALPSDADNVFITLTARDLCPSIHVIARAELQSTEKKLRQAGANRVVMPTVVGARQMLRMITRPATADLMDLVSQSDFVDLELDEFEVVPHSKLVGTSVHETQAHRKHNLLVVAIKQSDGQLLFNPDESHQFGEQDIVMVVGHTSDIEAFRREFDLD